MKFRAIGFLVIMALFFGACEKEKETTPDSNNQNNNDGSLVAVITADIETGDTPLKVNFDASSSTDSDGTISSYKWNFGEDDNSATTQICSYTYNNIGSFSVTLMVTDNDGNTDNATKTITVTEPTYLSLFPLNAIGSQWAYHVRSYKNTASPTTKEGDILVTLKQYNSSEKLAKFKVTGDLNYHSYQGITDEFQLKDDNGVLRYKDLSATTPTWKTAFQTSGSWSDFQNFLGRPAYTGQASIESVSGSSYTCGTGGDNLSDTYANPHVKYFWRHTINPETGFSHSKWYDYETDDDPSTPGPYSYWNEITNTGYSILQNDGTVLEDGTGTSLQLFVAQFSPGVTSGEEGMVIYNRTETIEISFTMEMNKSTVEQNLLVYSEWEQVELTGTFSWTDNKTLIWSPDTNYPDGYIRVTVPTSCQSTSNTPVSEEFQFYFFMDTNS